jgi:hypothetical protein
VKRLRLAVTLFALGVTFDARAADICPAPATTSSSGGFWSIPEAAFTESAAREALVKLEDLLGPNGAIADAIAWQNAFVLLEGWYLRRQALEAIERSQPEPFVSDFCMFLRERAYVRH